MKRQLRILKKKLDHHKIFTVNDLNNHTEIKCELEKIVEEQNSKTFNLKYFLKLLLEEDKLFCECGKNLRKYCRNNKSFRKNCIFCAKSVSSDTIKKTREKESTYYGELYNKTNTIKIIKNTSMSNYLGSGAQRRFIKENPKLYFSILEHTSDLNNLKGVNIRARIDFIKNPKLLYCQCGKYVKYYDNYTNSFFKVCSDCIPKKNSLEYYKLFYPDSYEEKYRNDRESRKAAAKNIHTLKWYEERYGDDGVNMYNKHVSRMLSNRSIKTHSKISRELFNNILLHGFEEAQFGTHPKEKMFHLDEEYSKKLNQKRIFVDFIYKNKIIEFQGDYWHSKTKQKDNIRKEFLEKNGYDVLFIYESDYKKDNINELNKCIRFLKGNYIQNRFQILTESGYSDFDNIIFTGNKETLKIELERDSIEVSKDHKFFKNGNEIIANTLTVGDTIQTLSGIQKILSITKHNEDTFEVLETNDHTYYANNILNHNCEFLGSSHTLINSDALKAMKPGEIIEKRDGKLNIYEYPKIGHKYFMTVDAAKDGRDFFSVQIVDVTEFTFKQVATAKLQIDYLLMPEFLNEWCELYNKPYLIIENNEGAGQSIADQMKNDYEYENLHSDKDGVRNRKKKYPGFRTTTKSRRQILQTMKLFIENNKLEVIDKDTIREFYQFILINNKFQADEGSHDDMIMSLAMVFVPFTNTKNFEDMKSVVNQLYNEEIEDVDKLSYGDVLVIGDFQDSVDEIDDTKKKMWNGYIVYEEGDLFI